MKEHYALVTVFFETMEYTKTVQRPAVSYQSVISDIGGLLGVTLGASIITVVELAEFGCLTLFQWVGKGHKKKTQVNEKSIN